MRDPPSAAGHALRKDPLVTFGDAHICVAVHARPDRAHSELLAVGQDRRDSSAPGHGSFPKGWHSPTAQPYRVNPIAWGWLCPKRLACPQRAQGQLSPKGWPCPISMALHQGGGLSQRFSSAPLNRACPLGDGTSPK